METMAHWQQVPRCRYLLVLQRHRTLLVQTDPTKFYLYLLKNMDTLYTLPNESAPGRGEGLK